MEFQVLLRTKYTYIHYNNLFKSDLLKNKVTRIGYLNNRNFKMVQKHRRKDEITKFSLFLKIPKWKNTKKIIPEQKNFQKI